MKQSVALTGIFRLLSENETIIFIAFFVILRFIRKRVEIKFTFTELTARCHRLAQLQKQPPEVLRKKRCFQKFRKIH